MEIHLDGEQRQQFCNCVAASIGMLHSAALFLKNTFISWTVRGCNQSEIVEAEKSEKRTADTTATSPNKEEQETQPKPRPSKTQEIKTPFNFGHCFDLWGCCASPEWFVIYDDGWDRNGDNSMNDAQQYWRVSTPSVHGSRSFHWQTAQLTPSSNSELMAVSRHE